MTIVKKIGASLALFTFFISLYAQPPRGLRNNGNACFINAALQCLYHLTDLRREMLALPNNYYKPNTFAAHYKDFLQEFGASTSASYDPSVLCFKGWQALRSANSLTLLSQETFSDYSQQDASELITLLLDHLTDTDIQDSIRKEFVPYPGTYKPNNHLSQLISSQLQTTRTRLGLFSFISSTIAPENQLWLEIQQNCKTLEDCLIHKFLPTTLDSNNKIVGATGQVTAHERLGLKGIAPYFIVGLRRTHNGTKILDPISFPLRALDLAPFMELDSDQTNALYHLTSFIVHSGSAHGGHYTAYVKKEDQWYYCNDSVVTHIPQEQIEEIANRGYGFDPDYIRNPERTENSKTSRGQTPVFFFYEQAKDIQ